MIEIVYLLIVIILYVTAYVVSLYSLAVYIDPDEVETLFPNISKSRQNLLKKLAGDPRAFVQIAVVYRSFALVIISVLSYKLLTGYAVFEEIPPWVIPAVGILLVWILFVITVEYLPRRSSRKAINNRMVRHLWIISPIYYIFFPIVGGLRGLLKRTNHEIEVTEEEKEEIVERAIETLAEQAGISETIVEQEEKEMIGQIFLLDQTVVREIMVPRINITAIEISMSFKDIRQLVLKDGHSRYPVYKGSIDKIEGLIYVKDLFNNLPEPGEEFDITSLLREPYFVPETKVIGDLLREFKTKRLHIAMVLDEYGGIAGLVTLEDIIEEIFGEIQDEHDSEQDEFQVLPDGRYMVDASMLVEELQDKLGTEYEQGDYDTVGGLIYDLVGSVPKEGQVIKWNDIEFEVEKVDGQRISLVTIRK